MTERDGGDGLDVESVVALLESFLLGGSPTLTGPEVAERAGIPFELARERWRSLGFTAVPDEEAAFTEADVEALRLTTRMRDLGLLGEEDEAALIRTLGRSFARLSEWQLSLLARGVDIDSADPEELRSLMAEVLPLVESVMSYVWRRHTLSAATRMLLAPTGGAQEHTQVVGFADIVGYTRQSRSLRQSELARLVDDFEAATLAVVTEHHGRIIKTIGDEVLFVADDPREGADIALDLAERHVLSADFPQLRVGMAYGSVLARLGDVFGPVVNMAARLTSTARPGRVLVDRELAQALRGEEDLRVRRMRRTAVKGYRRLEPWSLRRPLESDPELDPENLPGPASQFLAERGRDLVRAVDELHLPGERPSGRERPE